jgi:hypothetical protein
MLALACSTLPVALFFVQRLSGIDGVAGLRYVLN